MEATFITANYVTGSVNGGDGNGDTVGGLVGFISAGGNITANYTTASADGDANDHVGGLLGFIQAGNISANYAFGMANGGLENKGIAGVDLPIGITISNLTLAIANDPDSTNGMDNDNKWNSASNKTLNIWDFGDSTHIPALRYADYDGDGGIDYCSMFPEGVVCGTTLLPGQR